MRLKKWFVGLAIVIGVLFLLFQFVVWPMMKEETKKISPQKTSIYNQDGFDLTVNYSSPSKKGRVIFGELVPFDKVWRTGANEPTTFTTANAIKIIDKELPAGTYSLWTIPKSGSWNVIFNSEVADWGVTLISGGKETTRNLESDVLQIEAPTSALMASQEEFLIDFIATDQLHLSLSWDNVMVMVPINK